MWTTWKRRCRTSSLQSICWASRSPIGQPGRRRCQVDGRVVYAGLTERGWEVVRSAAPSHVRSVRARMFDALGPTDIAILDEMLPRLLARLRESDRS